MNTEHRRALRELPHMVVAAALGIVVMASIRSAPFAAERPSMGQTASAQSSDAASQRTARFDVVSIKPNPTGAAGPTSSSVQPGGRYLATNMPLRLLIGQTYHTPASRLVGGPGWLESIHFDIDARANRELTGPGTDRLLDDALAALLRDRFKLKVHSEMRQMTLYNLVLADPSGRLGPNLTRSTRDCDAFLAALRSADSGPRAGGPPPPPPDASGADVLPCSARNAPGQWVLDGQTLSFFAAALSSDIGQPVVDRTGLSGRYNLRLTWTPEQSPRLPSNGAERVPPIDPDAPALSTALRQQLGLRLEKATGPVEFLVIDTVEQPAPN